MKTIDHIDVIYEVSFPALDSTLENFMFSANTNDGVFKFTFQWFNDVWNCYVTLPDLSVRTIGVVPYVVNWSDFLDYSIFFPYDAEEYISFSELGNAKIEIIKWQK